MPRPFTLAIILLGLTACATTDGPFMETATDAEREEAIRTQFQSAAFEALRESNATFADDVADELRVLWQSGARRLVEDQASQSEVARAVEGARRIVLASVEGSLPSAGPARVITLNNIERARRWICPLYPFC